MILLNEFVIKGNPSTRTAQQKGARVCGGHIVFYEKPEVRKANEELYWKIYPHAPEEPYDGKLCVRLMWLFDKATMTKAENRTFKNTAPDLDNMAKGTLDIFQKAGFFKDDAQISKLELSKAWYRDYCGLFVQIWKMDDGKDFETYILDWRNRVT